MTNTDLSIKSYTDLNELNKLKAAGSKDDPRALKAVADQFESLFLNMLMKNMRKANESISDGGLFDSNESKFYQEMMDQQLSVSLSSGNGIGLSEVLVKQLTQKTGAAEVDQEQVKQLDQQVNHASGDLSQLMDRTAQLAIQASIKHAGEKLQVQSQAKAAEIAANMPERFESPEQFIENMMPLAQLIAPKAGIAPEVMVAQAALETGWGQHLPRSSDGESSYNLFGIKADQRWGGERTMVDTLEYRNGVAQQEKAAFRSYGSYEESMNDYLAFVQSSPRYQAALSQGTNGHAYIQQLQQAGYATDPAYANKISGILDGEMLKKVSNSIDKG